MITSILLIIAVMFGVNPMAFWALLITAFIDINMWDSLCYAIRNRTYSKDTSKPTKETTK